MDKVLFVVVVFMAVCCGNACETCSFFDVGVRVIVFVVPPCF